MWGCSCAALRCRLHLAALGGEPPAAEGPRACVPPPSGELGFNHSSPSALPRASSGFHRRDALRAAGRETEGKTVFFQDKRSCKSRGHRGCVPSPVGPWHGRGCPWPFGTGLVDGVPLGSRRGLRLSRARKPGCETCRLLSWKELSLDPDAEAEEARGVASSPGPAAAQQPPPGTQRRPTALPGDRSHLAAGWTLSRVGSNQPGSAPLVPPHQDAGTALRALTPGFGDRLHSGSQLG